MSSKFSFDNIVNNIAKETIEAILKPSSNIEETIKLKKIAGNMSVNDWKTRQISLVTAPGAAAGMLGGFWGYAAILADLVWLGKNAGQGCLGVGYALKKYVNRDKDIDLILGIWTGIIEPSNAISSTKTTLINTWIETKCKMSELPIDKVCAKLGVKSMAKVNGKMAGKVIAKHIAVKGGSKLGIKLTSLAISKASTKLAAKLAAKLGTSWIPLLGGVVSGGINLWLISNLMDAAEKYYTSNYLLYDNDDFL